MIVETTTDRHLSLILLTTNLMIRTVLFMQLVSLGRVLLLESQPVRGKETTPIILDSRRRSNIRRRVGHTRDPPVPKSKSDLRKLIRAWNERRGQTQQTPR